MLMELGVNEKWLIEANFTREEMTQLLKGILYLKEMQPESFKDLY